MRGRQVVAEFLGTAFLLAAVVGSGIMAERLAAGNIALALLANALATGAALVPLILTFGPISGAHFNPAVTMVLAANGQLPWRSVSRYVAAQLIGAIAGVLLAHAMFDVPLMQTSLKLRGGFGQWSGEFVATFGLIAVILGGMRHNPTQIPYMVGAYITAAYWFTSSTSFANPAVTIARGFTDSFAGIAPAHIPGFLVAQTLGAVSGALTMAWLNRSV